MLKKSFILAAITVSLSVFITACGSGGTADQKKQGSPSNPPAVSGNSEWDKVVEAAKKEGAVAVAIPPGDAMRDAVANFQKAYPDIKLTTQGFQGRDVAAKITAEHKAGKNTWDVYIGGATPGYKQMKPEGVLEVLPRDLPETLAKTNDSKWRFGFEDGFMDTDSKYVYAFAGYLTKDVYVNFDVIKDDQLKGLDDLLNPNYKGKISWSDPRQPGSGIAASSHFFNKKGEQYLRNLLTNQNVMITRDTRQQAEWIVRGTTPIAIGLDYPTLAEFQKNGAGLNVKALGNDAQHLVGGWGHVSLVKNAPHSNAAKVFINWLLSDQGQTAWTNTGENSRRLDVKVGREEAYADPKVDYYNSQKEKNDEFKAKAIKIANELIK